MKSMKKTDTYSNSISRILITGSNGFIGRNLQRHLNNTGINYRGLSREEGDITDPKLREIRGESLVIHLAGYLRGNFDDMKRINIEGTRNILELCVRNGCPIVFASSCAVYGPPLHNPVNEDHPKNPISIYGKTKLIAEELCKEYGEKFGINYSILRIFNIIGPRQRKGFLIPDIMDQIKSGKVKVRNTGSRRDFLDVDDLSESILKLIDGERKNYVLNIGRGESHSIGEILSILREFRDFNIESREDYSRDIREISSDITQVRTELSWGPRRGIRESLAKILDANE